MPADNQNVTITLYVDTLGVYNYDHSNKNQPPFNIDNYCHFEQVGGTKNVGNGKNEEFQSIVSLKDYKTITWEGKSSSTPAFGDVQILAIVNETFTDVFSSLICSGNPRTMLGNLENKTQNPSGDGEPYTIYFQLRLGPGNYVKMCQIDPKLEINP